MSRYKHWILLIQNKNKKCIPFKYTLNPLYAYIFQIKKYVNKNHNAAYFKQIKNIDVIIIIMSYRKA